MSETTRSLSQRASRHRREAIIPLYDALAAVDPASGEGAALWARYLDVWVKWNHVRTVAGIGALASFIMALR